MAVVVNTIMVAKYTPDIMVVNMVVNTIMVIKYTPGVYRNFFVLLKFEKGTLASLQIMICYRS